jgi:hypothetical protein
MQKRVMIRMPHNVDVPMPLMPMGTKILQRLFCMCRVTSNRLRNLFPTIISFVPLKLIRPLQARVSLPLCTP